jgi:hypothetical protein
VKLTCLNLSSFVSGRRSLETYHVHVDPDVLHILREKAHMSDRFLSDVYETEDWTRLDYGSAVRRCPQGKVKSLGASASSRTTLNCSLTLAQRYNMAFGPGTKTQDTLSCVSKPTS